MNERFKKWLSSLNSYDMERSSFYQWSLIVLLIASIALLSVFFLRELFPEYKVYQKAFVALENFRSGYTGESPAPFEYGVKQIVIKESKGPEVVDRCISCHVALDIQDYSLTRIKKDINGEVVRDARGLPIQEPNPDSVWLKLDQSISTLKSEGRLNEANDLESLKSVHVGESVYDLRKILVMHPLMGQETRPFEFHPRDSYGCVSCHGGNGRALTTDKAHGPVWDGEYEISFEGPKPQFLDLDPLNDPAFSKAFNNKPGDALIFQTTPLLVGHLIEARCVQCHQPSVEALYTANTQLSQLDTKQLEIAERHKKAFDQDIKALDVLYRLESQVKNQGLQKVTDELAQKKSDPTLPDPEPEEASAAWKFLKRYPSTPSALAGIQKEILSYLGSPYLMESFKPLSQLEPTDPKIQDFLKEHVKDAKPSSLLFKSWAASQMDEAIATHLVQAQNQSDINQIVSDIDLLTEHYQRGKDLYISQACYACHKIAGFARGGVGPELTKEGKTYPWFIKESIVWPQADLPTSTMPNYKLDHEELEDLMTFILAQRGEEKWRSPVQRENAIKAWETGQKLSFEKPIPQGKLDDLSYAMKVFALEGCASCHRLEGYDSAVGFKIEKDKPSFVELLKEKEWFERLIPETIDSQSLVKALEEHESEINQHIVDGVNPKGMLEELESEHPQLLPGFYAPFKYALRAKDQFFAEKLKAEPEQKEQILKEKAHWAQLVRRVMFMYYQDYGLGRVIGPRPNWSGIYRSDEWLMEHFWNPSSKIAKSIMPVFPFDDSKFWSLIHMLDTLGVRNRDRDRLVWEKVGFDPALAYKLHCAQCHGDNLGGNGPVSPWIYPIPKNLRNADFLRNLTKENAIISITHGVKGTPMAPWGETWPRKGKAFETPVFTADEIRILVDWIFNQLPGSRGAGEDSNIPKWQYTPEDIIQDMKNEGDVIQGSGAQLSKNFAWNMAGISGGSHEKTLSVGDVFEENQNPWGPKPLYYIKPEYYTAENLADGQRLFLLHCAVCHGKDADGAGNRAEAMQDAKPRMLTNLDWLDTRDDLRLIRSIKYGVPGTSMTPWGDVTSSKQRLQLVMYIRSLSLDNELRKLLNDTLFQVYDHSERAIYEAESHAEGPDKLTKLRTLEDSTKARQTEASQLGSLYLSQEDFTPYFYIYIDWLNAQEIIKWQDNKLQFVTQGVDAADLFKEKLIQDIQKVLNNLKIKKQDIKGRLSSDERDAAMNEVTVEETKWLRLQKETLRFFSQDARVTTIQKDSLRAIYG